MELSILKNININVTTRIQKCNYVNNQDGHQEDLLKGIMVTLLQPGIRP